MSLVAKHLRSMTKFHKFHLQVQGNSLLLEQKTKLWFQTTCLFSQENGAPRICILSFMKDKPLQDTIPSLKVHSNQYSTKTEQNDERIRDDERILHGVRSPLKENKKGFKKDTAEHFKKIAEVLSCSVEEVNKLSTRNKFLFHLEPQLLQEKVQLLLSYSISQSDINKNIRICYKISTKLLEERLRLMDEQSLLDSDSVRFLEGESKDFYQAIEYIIKKKKALEGCVSMSEYIQRRLECSEDEARRMLSSPPFNRGYTSIKLKALLDFFLLEAKVNSLFLIEHSFLFTFSVERLRHRLKIMNAVGIKDPLKMKAIWFYPTEKFNNVFKKHMDTS